MSSLVGQSSQWTQGTKGTKLRRPFLVDGLNRAKSVLPKEMAPSRGGYGAMYETTTRLEPMTGIPNSQQPQLSDTPATIPYVASLPLTDSTQVTPNQGPIIPSSIYGSSSDSGELADFIPIPPAATPTIVDATPLQVQLGIDATGQPQHQNGSIPTASLNPTATVGAKYEPFRDSSSYSGNNSKCSNYNQAYNQSPTWYNTEAFTAVDDGRESIRGQNSRRERENERGYGVDDLRYHQISGKLEHLLRVVDDIRMEPTQHATEEMVLYSFLGIFIICVVDSFTHIGRYIR